MIAAGNRGPHFCWRCDANGSQRKLRVGDSDSPMGRYNWHICSLRVYSKTTIRLGVYSTSISIVIRSFSFYLFFISISVSSRHAAGSGRAVIR